MIRQEHGFTLIEMLVALAIFAAAAAMLIITNGNAVKEADQLQMRVLASWIGANHLAYLEASQAWPIAGNKQESEQYAGREWSVRQEVENTENKLMRRVIISVYEGSDTTSERAVPLYQITGYLREYQRDTQPPPAL